MKVPSSIAGVDSVYSESINEGSIRLLRFTQSEEDGFTGMRLLLFLYS